MRLFIWLLILLAIIYVIKGIRVVPQNNEGLVETLGKYSKTVKAGMIFIWPFFQKLRKVPLALQPLTIKKYVVITKDNAEITISVTLNYLVTNSYKYFYNNTDSVESMIQLIRGHLRDIIGKMDLNAVLGSTKGINKQLFDATGDLTDVYGIKIIRVNVDELLPSHEIQQAMDKQLTASREKVAAISKAEGEAKTVEMTAKANNEAKVQTAKAEAQSVKIKADADAYKVNKLQTALNGAGDNYFRNQSLNSFDKLAKGHNNLIVLSKDDLTTLGKVPAIKQVWDKSKTKDKDKK